MNLRSQLRFFMHPLDELEFEGLLLQDDSIWFVDGPRWPTSKPLATKRLEELTSNYCIIWSRLDIQRLRATFIKECNDWYCSSEQATIQFLRSEMHGNGVLTEGRIAVSTPSYPTKSFGSEGIKRLEKRYNSSRAYIKKHFKNNAVAWIASGSEFKIDLLKPSTDVWVGPFARRWLLEDERRKFRQFANGSAEAVLVDIEKNA